MIKDYDNEIIKWHDKDSVPTNQIYCPLTKEWQDEADCGFCEMCDQDYESE